MPIGRNDRVFGDLYRLHGRIAAHRFRILLFVLLVALAAAGCGGDNGGGY